MHKVTNFKSKHHEADIMTVETKGQAIKVHQASESGTPIVSYFTFDAIEEMYAQAKLFRNPKDITVNGGVEYEEIHFKEMCEVLEKGDRVTVYIDCLGNGRNNREQDNYRVKLEEIYGNTLDTNFIEGNSYSYSYILKK